MAKNNDQTLEVEPSKTNNKTEKASQSSISAIVWFLLVVLMLISLGFGWLLFQQYKLNQDVEQRLVSVNVSAEQEQLQASRIAELESELANKAQAFEQGQSMLQQQLDILSDNQTLTSGDVEQLWVMSEIKYLLNLANHRVLLAQDLSGAQTALAMADDLLKNLHDHRLHPLRDLIAQEQLALASVVLPDTQGLALKLDSALNQVNSLQVLMAAPVEAETEVERSVLNANDWRDIASSAWQQVKSLVVIRHQQDGSAAVLVPEQRYFLYQNLMLKLETARFALLRGDNDTYQASLASAIEWLDSYFVGDKRDAMRALITELAEENILVEVPDISASATWLKRFEQ